MQEFYPTEIDKAGISSYNHREVIIVPYRDLEKRKAAVKKSHEKIYLTTITIKIRNDDKELYKRLISECEKLEVSPATFIREVTREKLGLPPRKPND